MRIASLAYRRLKWLATTAGKADVNEADIPGQLAHARARRIRRGYSAIASSHDQIRNGMAARQQNVLKP